MKRILIVLFSMCIATNVFAANKWLNQNNTDAVTGAQNVSDLDTTVTAYMQDPLNRMLPHYIWGCTLTRTSATVVTVSAGEVAITNSAGTIKCMRQNTATTTIDMAGAAGVGAIDSGSAEQASTWYDLYAVADADATTFTAICTEQGTAPIDVTYYRYIGSFFNDAAQNISNFSWFGNGSKITYIHDIPVVLSTTIRAAFTAQSCSAGMPNTSTMAILGVYGNAQAAPASVSFYVRPTGYTGSETAHGGLQGAGGTRWGGSVQVVCGTDTSQSIDYKTTGSGLNAISLAVRGFILKR